MARGKLYSTGHSDYPTNPTLQHQSVDIGQDPSLNITTSCNFSEMMMVIIIFLKISTMIMKSLMLTINTYLWKLMVNGGKGFSSRSVTMPSCPLLTTTYPGVYHNIPYLIIHTIPYHSIPYHTLSARRRIAHWKIVPRCKSGFSVSWQEEGWPHRKCHHCHVVTPRGIVRLNVYFSSFQEQFNLYGDKNTKHMTMECLMTTCIVTLSMLCISQS